MVVLFNSREPGEVHPFVSATMVMKTMIEFHFMMRSLAAWRQRHVFATLVMLSALAPPVV
jgi:hypothetical protein